MSRHGFPTITREMSIERALRWAFSDEFAQIDFDELGATAHGNRRGMDGIAVMIERGAIGCQVDGGGRSEPAWDAQVIASAVANLPQALGGRGMAVKVAEFARAAARPDWIEDDAMRCVPRDWRMTKHGPFAKSEVAGVGSYLLRGQKVVYESRICPVRYTPTPQQVASARKAYRQWFHALLFLAVDLRRLNILARIRITQALPPRNPWLRGGLTAEMSTARQKTVPQERPEGKPCRASAFPEHRSAT